MLIWRPEWKRELFPGFQHPFSTVTRCSLFNELRKKVTSCFAVKKKIFPMEPHSWPCYDSVFSASPSFQAMFLGTEGFLWDGWPSKFWDSMGVYGGRLWIINWFHSKVFLPIQLLWHLLIAQFVYIFLASKLLTIFAYCLGLACKILPRFLAWQ